MDDFTLDYARKIRRLGLGNFTIALIDALKPLAIIGAQVVYALDPFVGASDDRLVTFGRILEDPEQTAIFLDHLREEETS
jgi:hypothetical protein